MRTLLVGAGIAVLVFMGLPGTAIADCEGGPVFPETIYAQDKNTFVWQTPMDVEYAKGDLAQLGSFTLWLRGTLISTNTLPKSRDSLINYAKLLFYCSPPLFHIFARSSGKKWAIPKKV